MADWSSSQYLKFKNQRTQPAVDLAMRVVEKRPKTVVDIGCGPGNSTAVLRRIFPDAELLGIDSSPDMIERARREHPDLRFRLCDARALEGQYDLLFSNACLQWIPDHASLIPALMDKLREGGTLAVQMPMNGEEPLYHLIREMAAEPEWGLRDAVLQTNETITPAAYFDILTGCAADFDKWEVKYYHPLADHRALVEWVKGTKLRPHLDFLGAERGRQFEEALVRRAAALYPVRKDGGVVLGFRRFFFTAER